MKQENECYTYFGITGDFDPDYLEKKLKLKPFRSWTKGDIRRDGKPFDFSSFCVCRIDEYSPYVSEMMEQTIEPLLSKVDLLNKLRKELNLSYRLAVVPKIQADGVHPCLSPSMKVIDFCHYVRCKLDIDLYIFD